MNLRIRGPNGQCTLKGTLNRFFYGSNVDLDEDISVRALLERLAEETQLPANCLELRGGFPPRELEIPSDGSIAAKEAFEIQHNDLVTVQKKSEVALVSGGNLGEASNKDAGVHVNVESFPAPSTDGDADLARAIAASLGEEVDLPSTTAIPGVIEKGRPAFEPLPSGKAAVRRIVPDDNSCLFSSIAYVMGRGRCGAAEMRSLVAEAIISDPVQWNEVVLGRDPSEYAAWILDMSKWGGSIELSIFSQQLAVEISAFDVQTQRVDTYGENQGYSHRVIVVYDGLHYDALALAAYEGASESLDLTKFPVGSSILDEVMGGCSSLVSRYHDERQFTDTARFTLRCNICNSGIVGEKGAMQHAHETGHQNFSEY